MNLIQIQQKIAAHVKKRDGKIEKPVATHFSPKGITSCGTYGVELRLTKDILEVTCQRCIQRLSKGYR